MSAEQKTQKAIEDAKVEEMRRIRAEQKEKATKNVAEDFPLPTASSLPPVGMPQSAFGLPTIGSRGGAFEVDAEAKKRAQLAMMKLDDIMGMDEKKTEEEDKRSMMEVMRAKREATEKLVEEQKANSANLPESIEDRQKRLKAQRDLLRKMKDNERAKELEEFNAKTQTKGNLYDELKKIDENK